MARDFSILVSKMSPESRERAEEKAQKMMADMPLSELRRARGLSQEVLASALNIKQPSVAKIEKRTDMYISTLRSHIQAMGGELEIIARFPDGAVRITNFSEIEPGQREYEGRPAR